MVDKKRSVNGVCAVLPDGILYPAQRLCIGLSAVLLPAVGQRLGNDSCWAGKFEIEKAVNAAGVILRIGEQPLPCLAHHVGVGLCGLYIVVDPGKHFHVFAGGSAVKFLHRVQPETARAFFQPEIHDRLKFFPKGLAFKIHIGHPAPENTLIIVIAGAHLIPGVRLGIALYKVIVFIVGAFCGGRLLLAAQRLQIAAGSREPGMLR